jgi:hypothetical protein
MDWKEFLAKFRLADVKAEGKQVGLINVNIENKAENKTYNFNFYNREAAEVFVAGNFKINEDFEKTVKQEAERRLVNLGISPDLLSESARTEITTLTAASTAVSVRMVEGIMTFETHLDARVSPSEKPKK